MVQGIVVMDDGVFFAALLIDAAVLGVGVCCLTKTFQLKKIMENFHSNCNISKRSGDMFFLPKLWISQNNPNSEVIWPLMKAFNFQQNFDRFKTIYLTKI